MQPISIHQITDELSHLPPEKLAVVYDFVRFLSERQAEDQANQTVYAAESALRKDWDRPEEDEAWATLS